MTRPLSAAVLVAAATLAAAASTAPAAITFGANLDRPANATYTCAALPAGPVTMPIGATTCTVFTTSAGLFSTDEANIVPQDAGGYGVITKVRVKAGSVTGPMRVVTFRSMRQSQSTGAPGCCWPQYATEVFTPPAGAVYEAPARLPVMNDTLLEAYLPMPGSALPSGPNTDPYGGLHEAMTGVQGIQTYDQIALSVLDATARIPAHYDGTNVPGGMFWPHLDSRTMRTVTGADPAGNGAATAGSHVLLQAVWEPDTDRDGLGDETQDPQVGTPAAPAPAAPVAQPPAPVVDRTPPALTFAPRRTGLRALRTRGLPVTVTCNEACAITARLLMDRAAARRAHLAVAAKPVSVGRGTARLTAPGKATVTVKLTRKAAKALRRTRRVRLTLEVRAVDAKGNAAVRQTTRTFR